MNINNNKDYTIISLNDYFKIIEAQQLEERIEKSIKEFDNIYKSLNEFSK